MTLYAEGGKGREGEELYDGYGQEENGRWRRSFFFVNNNVRVDKVEEENVEE